MGLGPLRRQDLPYDDLPQAVALPDYIQVNVPHGETSSTLLDRVFFPAVDEGYVFTQQANGVAGGGHRDVADLAGLDLVLVAVHCI